MLTFSSVHRGSILIRGENMKKVAAAIIVQNNKIFIARRNAQQTLPLKWEFPGGKIEEKETPEECLRRELHEELGVDAKIGDFFAESTYEYDHGSIHLLCYWTELLSAKIIPTVHDKISWVSPDKLRNYDWAPADWPVIEKLMNLFIHP